MTKRRYTSEPWRTIRLRAIYAAHRLVKGTWQRTFCCMPSRHKGSKYYRSIISGSQRDPALAHAHLPATCLMTHTHQPYMAHKDSNLNTVTDTAPPAKPDDREASASAKPPPSSITTFQGTSIIAFSSKIALCEPSALVSGLSRPCLTPSCTPSTFRSRSMIPSSSLTPLATSEASAPTALRLHSRRHHPDTPCMHPAKPHPPCGAVPGTTNIARETIIAAVPSVRKAGSGKSIDQPPPSACALHRRCRVPPPTAAAV